VAQFDEIAFSERLFEELDKDFVVLPRHVVLEDDVAHVVHLDLGTDRLQRLFEHLHLGLGGVRVFEHLVLELEEKCLFVVVHGVHLAGGRTCFFIVGDDKLLAHEFDLEQFAQFGHVEAGKVVPHLLEDSQTRFDFSL